MRQRTSVLLVALGGAILCTAQPASHFRLIVPGMGSEPLDVDVLELPGTLPKSVQIQVLNPIAADVDYGRIHTKLNSESAGFITTVSNASAGKIARLDFNLRQGMKLKEGVNTIEVLAITRRGRKYYRNFVLKTAGATRNEYFTYQTRLSPKDEAALAPEVIVLEPEFPITLEPAETHRTVRIRGTVTTQGKLGRILLAGKELKGVLDKTTIDFDESVRVTPAMSRLQVEAVDANGNVASVSVPVTPAQVRPTNLGGGKRYAFVVGVSEHASKPELPRLPRASLDAREFATMLEEKLGFAPEDVLLLTDKEATVERIRAGFRAISVRPKADDLFVVYFAGYGLHDPINPEALYLAAHGAQFGMMSETALPLEELQSLMVNVRAGCQLMLFEVDRPLPEAWGLRHTNLINDYLTRTLAKPGHRTVMVASALNQTTAGSGLFTQRLIAGSLGQADQDRDGVVTVRELAQYVASAVRRESQGTQVPQFSGDGEAVLAIKRR